MDAKTRKENSDANEDHACKWFEASGFASQKLDTGRSKSADWRFTKHNLAILCEVKTIYSGGQSALTLEQYERRRLVRRRKLDSYKEQAIADASTLLVSQRELDYIEGRIAYPKQNIRKEEAFHDFLTDIHNRLMADNSIKELPFSISITIDGMYIAYRQERTEFIEWLKGFVLWARQHHSSERIDSTSTFTFIPARRANDGTIQKGVEAFVQMMGPLPYPQLEVRFLEGGGSYHEALVAKRIDEAVIQLRASISKERTAKVLPVVALWSVSSYLNFFRLLSMDTIGAQLHEPPERYYLFDWAFSQYPDLASIVLFELHRDGDFWNPTPHDKVFPVGFVITNPNLPDAEKALKTAITETCKFITGLASDPLDQPIG